MVVGNNTFSTSRSNQVDRIIARRGVSLSREEWEGGLLASFAPATRGLRRPSLDARSGSPNRPPSHEENASKLGKDEVRSMRAWKDRGEDLPDFTVT